jgi:hypothetical protein
MAFFRLLDAASTVLALFPHRELSGTLTLDGCFNGGEEELYN